MNGTDIGPHVHTMIIARRCDLVNEGTGRNLPAPTVRDAPDPDWRNRQTLDSYVISRSRDCF